MTTRTFTTQTPGLASKLAALSLSLAATLLAPLANAETVMITGANSGIGLEFAKEYAAKGWSVIVTHRRSELPPSLAELQKKYVGKIRVEHLDVTNVDEATALATKMKDVTIDVLINNAGVYNDRAKCSGDDDSCPGDWTNQTFENMNYKLLDTIMAVNIKGPLIVSHAFYPNVKASKLKKLVAISSSNGTLTGEKPPGPGAMFYRMSKAALNREFQIVAASVKADGVTVLMLNPGPTLTEHQAYIAKTTSKIVDQMLTMEFTVGHMIATIDKATFKDTGKFLRYDGVDEAW